MCGIAGIMYSDPSRPIERGRLAAMGQSLVHRGPDAEGFLEEPGIGLVHRRLSIIDLEGGQQPMDNEDGSVWVVFNGEIYNFQMLRDELAAAGHRFRTRSDTEVLVHLYEEVGERMVERLRGMFVFAIWDRRSKELFLARDRLGIKPLYIYRDDEKLLFGSELKAILAHGDVDRSVDPAALDDYLMYGMVPGPRSILVGIEKLPPAHILKARPGDWSRSPRRYWRLQLEPDERPTPDEWKEAIRAKFDEAARLHMIADVPVGAFLSGGVDSSIVVASCAGTVLGSLLTFSIGLDDVSRSELPYARQVAERFGTRHQEEVVTADAAGIVEELAYYFDEPFADTSAIPTFLVARLASRSVKVALSGDGGDEAFGGYTRYAHDLKEAAIRRRLPVWLRRGGSGRLAQVWPKADWLPRPLRVKTFLTNLTLDAGLAYANTLALCRQPLRHRLLAPEVASRLNGHDPGAAIRDSHATAPPGDDLAGMISADLSVILPDGFLVKVDRASMANGLEVRPPLLDHELMELAGRIPSSLKVHRGETKWILKRAYQRDLPVAVTGRAKQGFEIPIDRWLRGPLRELFEASVLSSRGNLGGLVNLAAARELYRAHVAGVGRYGEILWGLITLDRWADRYLGPSAAPAPASWPLERVRG